MTEKSSIVPRVIGAIIAAIVFIAIVAMILNVLLPFELGVPASGLIPANDFATAVQNVSTMLWANRIIDVLVQGLLLAAAAIGAAALFRLEAAKKEEKEE